jgi:hypothetical protein
VKINAFCNLSSFCDPPSYTPHIIGDYDYCFNNGKAVGIAFSKDTKAWVTNPDEPETKAIKAG